MALRLRASAYGANAARPLTLRLGRESIVLDLGDAPSEQTFEAFLAEPLSVLAFEGIVPERPEGDDSARVLGIGLWTVMVSSASLEQFLVCSRHNLVSVATMTARGIQRAASQLQ